MTRHTLTKRQLNAAIKQSIFKLAYKNRVEEDTLLYYLAREKNIDVQYYSNDIEIYLKRCVQNGTLVKKDTSYKVNIFNFYAKMLYIKL